MEVSGELSNVNYRPVAPLIFVAVLIDTAFLLLAFVVGPSGSWQLNVLAILAAMSFSVPTGLLLTPVNPQEVSQFHTIGGALFTFLTGYFVRSVDPIVATTMAQPLNLTVIFPLLAFGSVFAIGTVTIYSSRRYIDWTVRMSSPEERGSGK